jgi:hypothetical protein
VQYRAHPDALRAGEEPPPGVGPIKSGLSGVTMTENRARNGKLGVIIGALIAVGLAVFLLTGGEHVGKKTVNSDADLPPIAKGQSRWQQAHPSAWITSKEMSSTPPKSAGSCGSGHRELWYLQLKISKQRRRDF